MLRVIAALAAALLVFPSGPAGAQAVRLLVQPDVGDTLRLRMEQRIEMTGITRTGGHELTRASSSHLEVFSRAIVTGRDGTASILMATTDSVAMSSTGADSLTGPRDIRRALLGKRVYLRVDTNGGTQAIGGDPLGSSMSGLMTPQLPATFPREPIEVGHTWTRTLTVPVNGQAPPSASSTLQATFRLDSLSRDASVAWLSLHGTIVRDDRVAATSDGTMLASSGNVRGDIVVDRERGWIVDARFTVETRSVVTPPPGGNAKPMRVRMTITQWFHALP